MQIQGGIQGWRAREMFFWREDAACIMQANVAGRTARRECASRSYNLHQGAASQIQGGVRGYCQRRETMVQLQSLPPPAIDQTLSLIYPKKRYGDSHFHDRAVDLWDDLGLEDDGPSLGAPPQVPKVTRDPLCEERSSRRLFVLPVVSPMLNRMTRRRGEDRGKKTGLLEYGITSGVSLTACS